MHHASFRHLFLDKKGDVFAQKKTVDFENNLFFLII